MRVKSALLKKHCLFSKFRLLAKLLSFVVRCFSKKFADSLYKLTFYKICGINLFGFMYVIIERDLTKRFFLQILGAPCCPKI